MEEQVKNLCALIPAGLHARVREAQEASGQTLHDVADPDIL